MARMYPPELPPGSAKSLAEERVYEALRDELPEEWEAYHSASFIIRDHAEGAGDGEIDFVLCHPDRAIVCLEVKGGGFECRNGEFFRTKGGTRDRMKDPFAQALDHRYNLRRLLDSRRKGAGSDTFVVHALVFPDVSIHELVLAPDAPHQIVIDRLEMRDKGMALALDEVLEFYEGSRDKHKHPGAEVANLLRETLVPSADLAVTLAAQIDQDEHQIIRLSKPQMLLLNGLARAVRVDVTGMAGTGKTLLAVEHARRRAAMGRVVAYVCFTRELADDLRGRDVAPGVRISTFHKLCAVEAQTAGIALPYHGQPNPPQEHWREHLPAALADASDAAKGLFDDIIVDEAQDLSDDYLTALTCALRDEASGQIWIFRDDNQRVFGSDLHVPDGFTPFDLDTNFRNTQAIHAELVPLYAGEITPQCIGPEGRPVEHITTDDPPSEVSRVIGRLCGAGEVPYDDVVVLSPHPLKSSPVGNAKADAFVFTTHAFGHALSADEHRPRVRFESIKAFKGLESSVVILCELDDLDDEARERELYVGLSRARSHCVVVGE